MQYVRRFFGLDAIYAQQTVTQVLYIMMCVLFGAVYAWLWLPAVPGIVTVLTVCIVVIELCLMYVVIRMACKAYIVKQYLKDYVAPPVLVRDVALTPGSIDAELDGVDILQPITERGDTRAFLATYNFHTRTKHGDFLARRAFYTVVEVRLHRVLPHVLFDSKTAKGRQFKHMYLKVQQLSVQGSFDDDFVTYVPQTYAIDSLSFVTPEVMEQLVAAKQCDIEIVGDRLLLYAPLVKRSGVDVLITQAEAIARHLNDNIDTYRDDRLQGKARKTQVTPFARAMLRSPQKHLILASMLGCGIIGLLIGSLFVDPVLRDDLLLNQLSIAAYIVWVIQAGTAYKIIRDNREAMHAYHILYHTDRGKPIHRP